MPYPSIEGLQHCHQYPPLQPVTIFWMFSKSYACNGIPQPRIQTNQNPNLMLRLYFSNVRNIGSPFSNSSLHISSALVSMRHMSNTMSPPRYFDLMSSPPSHMSSSSSLSNIARFLNLPTQALLNHVLFSIGIVN